MVLLRGLPEARSWGRRREEEGRRTEGGLQVGNCSAELTSPRAGPGCMGSRKTTAPDTRRAGGRPALGRNGPSFLHSADAVLGRSWENSVVEQQTGSGLRTTRALCICHEAALCRLQPSTRQVVAQPLLSRTHRCATIRCRGAVAPISVAAGTDPGVGSPESVALNIRYEVISHCRRAITCPLHHD